MIPMTREDTGKKTLLNNSVNNDQATENNELSF